MDASGICRALTSFQAVKTPIYLRICCYLVEDGNLNGHPVLKRFGPGPTEALKEFLGQNSDFEVERSRERRHFVSFSPGGYLTKEEVALGSAAEDLIN